MLRAVFECKALHVGCKDYIGTHWPHRIGTILTHMLNSVVGLCC